MRCYADNVLVALEPLEKISKGGLHLPQQSSHGARGHRIGLVLSSGPGHYAQARDGANGTVEQRYRFVPNETRPGDRVILDAQAGQVWDGEISIPRHNTGHEFEEIAGFAGRLRIVRESEILGVIEDGEIVPA